MPDIRYPVANPLIGGNERKYVDECIDTHWISSSGKYIQAFETSFSDKFGPGVCVAVCNGTIAIDLALEAVGVSPGDEVIVPNFTFAGSVSPIYRLHAIPVLVPPNHNNWNVDVDEIESRITKKTKAIIAVHLYGIPCDIKRIMEIAKKHHIAVIEDAAEALGAKVDGQFVGTFGDVGCFSFFGNKVLTTGEGGMCICKNAELANRIKLYRDHGMTRDERYWHKVIGYNGRMTNMQAAVGLGQLESIEGLIHKRMEIRKAYSEVFDQTDFFQDIKIPDHTEVVNWLQSPVLKIESNFDRNKLGEALLEKGVETRPFFYPIAQMPAFSRFGLNDEYSDMFSSHGFNLPTYTQLTLEEVTWIAEQTCEILKEQYNPGSGKTFPLVLPSNKKPEYQPDVSIILPTLNESGHINEIITILRSEMVSISKDYELIIVDDGSTDGTIDCIKKAFSHERSLKIIQQTSRQGLAVAISTGVKEAQGEYVLVMDTNFNHDPHLAGKIVKFCEDFDLVSGSRFTTGGSMEKFNVWLCSYIYNFCLRLLLGLKTQDNLAGYFCIRKKYLETLNESFIFYGHGDYFFRLLYLAHQLHYSILEVPIAYKTGQATNTSKSFFWTLLVYTKRALKLRFKSGKLKGKS